MQMNFEQLMPLGKRVFFGRMSMRDPCIVDKNIQSSGSLDDSVDQSDPITGNAEIGRKAPELSACFTNQLFEFTPVTRTTDPYNIRPGFSQTECHRLTKSATSTRHHRDATIK